MLISRRTESLIRESKLPVVIKIMTTRKTMDLISTETMEAKTRLTWTWSLSQRETNSPSDSLVVKKALKVRLTETVARSRRAVLMARGTDEKMKSFDA